ncbi:MAG: class I SAM-dependent methyltransferase [Candidatus Ancaeobacter aquaticus]|nr:class I SAM-dependent methyltransferase [Candidatus Ancaeobacter aquaticus]
MVNVKEFNNQRYRDEYGFCNQHSILLQKYLKKEYNVLDIGCGSGLLAASIKNNVNNVVGVDLSFSMLKHTLEKNIPCCLANIDGIHLSFKDKCFDLVFAGEIIEHLYDTSFFLREIKRVLKESGILILTTPNLASLGRRLMLLVGKNPLIESSLDIDSENIPAGHIRYFVKSALEKLLIKSGFEIIKISSDEVILDMNGRIKSVLLAKLFPEIGRCLIVVCRT